jgi:hypothetical protein
MAVAALAGADRAPEIARKPALAEFFAARILPQTIALEASVLAGPKTLMALEADMI